MRLSAALRAATLGATLPAGLACGPSRDVVPETRDVRVVEGEQAARAGGGGYARVARRPHGVVALADARQLTDDDAQRLVDRVADDLERCSAQLEREGALVDGAARIAAQIGPRGTPEGFDVRVAPGGAVAANALLCVIAPIRALTLSAPPGGTTPTFTLDATWAPTGAPRSAAPPSRPGGGVDAGGAAP